MKRIEGKTIAITDSFWAKRQRLVSQQVLPYQWEALNDRIADAEPSHAIENFRTAAAMTAGNWKPEAQPEFQGCVFQDSDLAKWIEAAAFSLNWNPDPKLEQTLDETIDLICQAQQPDGYLNTYFIINGQDKRFTNLTDNHEMYCLGHFLEAACAYYHATGKDQLLKALIRYVDLIDRTFGPEEGKKKGYPGHEELELALMKLYEITKDEKHLRLAAYLINQRGQEPLYFREEQRQYGNEYFWKDSLFQYAYYQAHKPVREQNEAVGHAVRAMYLYCGMADVAAATGDESLKGACRTLWNDVVNRKMYLTGAIGSSSYGEAFTFAYDLPNDQIYGESCASIGLVMFAMRMLQLDFDSQYADVMERALYNGIISGISLDGTHFFYVNPLEVKPKALKRDQRLIHVKGVRQKWFGCACCPPNIARLLASLGDYLYTVEGDTVYQNLFVGSKADAQLENGGCQLEIRTDYPWDGAVHVLLCPEQTAVRYAFRVPGWCRSFTVISQGKPVSCRLQKGYAFLPEAVTVQTELDICFEMPVRFVKADPRVRQDVGRSAIMRGPLVYCLEEEDNGAQLETLHLAAHTDIQTEFCPELLEGIVRITMTGEQQLRSDASASAGEGLYCEEAQLLHQSRKLIFIPYYAWANRTPGEMQVWVAD